MQTGETFNTGKAVATRVGMNIREIRSKLVMTQAQLAAPDFSISYISAIERGKIRPSLKALSLLARRLDVPITLLLEGSPSIAAEIRAAGFSLIDADPDRDIDVDLLQAKVLVQQGAWRQAERLLAPIQPKRLTTDLVYRFYLLQGEIHFGANEYQEAVVDLRAAVTQGEVLKDNEYTERARNLLGKAYFLLNNYTLALENHLQCLTAIENGQIPDPFFSLDVYRNLADDYFRLENLEKALTYYHHAVAMFDGMNHNSKSFAQKYMEISQNYKAAGKLTMARDFAIRSLALYNMRDEQKLVGIIHQRLGKTFERQNDLGGAEQEYHRAIALLHELGDAVSASTSQTSLAELLLKHGKRAEAEKEAEAALSFAQSGEDVQVQGQALIALAYIRHQAGDFKACDELFTQALELLDSSHDHEITASAYFRFANLLEERGEIQRSLHLIKRAYERGFVPTT
jgi:tetratricopeptide (TPR) repeat protein